MPVDQNTNTTSTYTTTSIRRNGVTTFFKRFLNTDRRSNLNICLKFEKSSDAIENSNEFSSVDASESEAQTVDAPMVSVVLSMQSCDAEMDVKTFGRKSKSGKSVSFNPNGVRVATIPNRNDLDFSSIWYTRSEIKVFGRQTANEVSLYMSLRKVSNKREAFTRLYLD